MSLDPTLNPYALAVAGAAAVTAASMHAVALAGSGHSWPLRRVLIANLISTALVGASVSWLISVSPWRIDLIGVLVASGIAGHVLGPRGVAWLFGGLLQALRDVPVVGRWVPPDPDADATPPPRPLPVPSAAPTPPEVLHEDP